MILKDNFYSVVQFDKENSLIAATLKLNVLHPVFEGHFPGQPVVPGVCMIQMIKEILELASGRSLMMKQSDYIKFLSVINPLDEKPVEASVRYEDMKNEGLHVIASLRCEDRICLKLKAVFADFV